MGIIKEKQTQSTNQAITKVIQAQRSLAIRHYHPDLMSYLGRASWKQTAHALTEQYWPRTVSKELYIQNEIEALYGAALILGPLSGQCPGFWNPWRHKGHLVSWFRQHVHGQQKGWLCVHRWDWKKQLPALSSSMQAFGIADSKFAEHCYNMILNNTFNSFSESLREQFARKIFAPILFHEQAKEIYLQAKAKQAVVWWDERYALVLASSSYQIQNGAWFDLSLSPVDVWNFEVRAKKEKTVTKATTGQHGRPTKTLQQDKKLMLYIFLHDQFLKSSRVNIKSILRSHATDQAKVFQVSSELKKVYSWGKFCFQAQPQCNQLAKWARDKIETQIFQQNQKLRRLYFEIYEQKWDTGFYPRKGSGLLDNKLMLENWVKWWRPWR